MKRFCVLFAILAVGSAAPAESVGLVATALRFVKDCGDKSMVLCMKERALHYMDAAQGDIEVVEGINLVQTEAQPTGGRSLNDVDLPVDVEEREAEIDSLLVDRVARFLQSHTLQFKVSKDSIQDMQRSLDEARGKKKKAKKLLLPLLLLMKLKAAALLPLLIGGIALLAFKALVIGKLALLISGIIGLKKLLGGQQKSQTYEVVAHPHEESHGGHYRSFDSQSLAYKAHAQ